MILLGVLGLIGVAIILLGSIITIVNIGKPRETITPGSAAFIVSFNLVFAVVYTLLSLDAF